MRRSNRAAESPPHARDATKKDQILSLYLAGITDVQELAAITDSRPSYVASVLHGAELLPGYFDLYTHTSSPMNIYSRPFAGKLGFKTEEVARESVELLNQAYRQYEHDRDRAGQHHMLLLALTMFDRARWIGKLREAAIFRDWLSARVADTDGASAVS
ncbi:MAG TPA: hypothetical protein VGY58_04885 [Gemmataceae bacterium]|jgi:hypothetical protein|nr:hypothetical protein [Gemmataceae bacterium]